MKEDTNQKKRKGISVSLTTQELAVELGVTSSTIIAWIRSGVLKAYRTPGKHRRIPREEVEKFKKEYFREVAE
jgi:excisionase family DNA binding protein